MNRDSFYVVATSPNGAYNKLKRLLDKEDIYFSSDRELRSVEKIADSFYEHKCIFEER